MKKYVCEVCGYVYDPNIGDIEHGIPTGTSFEELPENWLCPPCGVSKEHFSEVVEYQKENKKELYMCEICGYVYDPNVGDIEHGIPAGTSFEELSKDWVCPPCGAGKEHFSKMKF